MIHLGDLDRLEMHQIDRPFTENLGHLLERGVVQKVCCFQQLLKLIDRSSDSRMIEGTNLFRSNAVETAKSAFWCIASRIWDTGLDQTPEVKLACPDDSTVNLLIVPTGQSHMWAGE